MDQAAQAKLATLLGPNPIPSKSLRGVLWQRNLRRFCVIRDLV
jgi:hypothetical protein